MSCEHQDMFLVGDLFTQSLFLGQALEEAPPALRGDREVVLCAVKSSKGWALQCFGSKMQQRFHIFHGSWFGP